MAKARHPDVGVTSDPARFKEAIAAFKKRVPMPKAEFDQLQAAEREFAFTVAGVAQADLVAQVYEGIERAIRDGTTLDDFKAEVGEALETSWGKAAPARIETIFRTNVQRAYSEGRHSVFSAPAVKDARPYLRFEAIDDDRTDEDCADADGTVLPQDDTWWTTHIPPLHPNCRCSTTALTPEEAGEEGIDDQGPAVDTAEGFGDRPSEDGVDWQPDTHDYPAAIGDILENVLK